MMLVKLIISCLQIQWTDKKKFKSIIKSQDKDDELDQGQNTLKK